MIGERVHKAFMHPTRRSILLQMHEAGRLSPTAYSKAAGETMSATTYHFEKLLDYEAIELVGTSRRGAAVEHIYALSPQSPVVRFLLESELPATQAEAPREDPLARLLGGNSRRTSLRIVPVLADPEGMQEVEETLQEARARLVEIDAAARARLEESSQEPATVHVALTAFGAG
ncbi:MAG TPA: helix-turn-helix domain-containing protein [Solirubrobacterales bacterium]|nr:helix-turn-helix domain-containing protein [Solirubrobacterales bacterium]